jgi:hypothetical protein
MASDNVDDISLSVLIGIREEMAGMRTELRTEIGALRTDMNGRFDNLIETMGGTVRGHLGRITSLEERVEKLERQGPRRRPSGGPRRRP